MTLQPSQSRQVPGEIGIWVFIIADLCLFGLLFLLYAHDCGRNRAMFLAGQATLNARSGLVNTLFLLSGSFSVVLGLQYARISDWKNTSWFLIVGMAFGLLFLAVKAEDYVNLVAGGYTVSTNLFYNYYFVVTGIHAVHVAIGVTVLGWFAADARGRVDGGTSGLESAGCYWHMVDLLWIGIFALIYLMK